MPLSRSAPRRTHTVRTSRASADPSRRPSKLCRPSDAALGQLRRGGMLQLCHDADAARSTSSEPSPRPARARRRASQVLCLRSITTGRRTHTSRHAAPRGPTPSRDATRHHRRRGDSVVLTHSPTPTHPVPHPSRSPLSLSPHTIARHAAHPHPCASPLPVPPSLSLTRSPGMRRTPTRSDTQEDITPARDAEMR